MQNNNWLQNSIVYENNRNRGKKYIRMKNIKKLKDRELQELEHDTMIDLCGMMINSPIWENTSSQYKVLVTERELRGLKKLPELRNISFDRV